MRLLPPDGVDLVPAGQSPRHSYITHLIEAGYDPAFVQTQAGHAYASLTSVYTSVGDDFKQKTIQKMIACRIARPEEANPGSSSVLDRHKSGSWGLPPYARRSATQRNATIRTQLCGATCRV